MNADTLQRVAFQQSVDTTDEANACLRAAFELLGQPDTMLDLGCGDGHMCRLASALGVYSIGVDLYVEPEDNGELFLECRDLTVKWHRPPCVNLTLCLEVGEHLPAEAAGDLAQLCAMSLQPGGHLLFSAATPGQGGSGHINEQPHTYWRTRLVSKGLKFDAERTKHLSARWSEVAPGAWWYGKNVNVFTKEEQ